MERRVSWITPLVTELAHLCQCHEEEGESRAAAAGMLEHLRQDWTGIPVVSLPADGDDDRGAEELCLAIVRDVGEAAGILASASDLADNLAWARANLIQDLERYTIAAGAEA